MRRALVSIILVTLLLSFISCGDKRSYILVEDNELYSNPHRDSRYEKQRRYYDIVSFS